MRNSWGIVLAGCLVVVLAGFGGWYTEAAETPVPFLTQTSLDRVSFQDQWDRFRQQAGISEDARVEEFHLIHDQRQQAVSLRLQILDEVDGQFYRYLSKACYDCPVKGESGKAVWKKRRLDIAEAGETKRLAKATSFFQALDAGMQSAEISRSDFPYYVIASDGTYETVALPGTYYQVKRSKVKRMPSSNREDAAGFSIKIRGSGTPGPFPSSDEDVLLLF